MLKRIFAAGVALVTYAHTNAAAAFEQTNAFAPRLVSLDDHRGAGFEWTKPLPCGTNRATVTLKYEKSYTAAGGRQMPVAKVWLHAGQTGESSEEWFAAVIKAPTDTWKLNALTWLEKVTDTSSESAGGYAPADVTRPLQLTFTWTPDGVITVNFNGEFAKKVVADSPVTSIGLGGSWSKFQFVDLQVGRDGAPDPACATTVIAHSATAPLRVGAR